MTKAPTVEAMRADVRPGLCIVCELPLPPRKHQKPRSTLCGHRECQLVYTNVYRADWAKQRRAK